MKYPRCELIRRRSYASRIECRLSQWLIIMVVAALTISVKPFCAAQSDQLSNLISRARAALGPGLSRVHTLHLTGKLDATGISGTFESWIDLTTGQYLESVDAGPFTGARGYDGKVAWMKDSKGVVLVQNGPAARAGNAEKVFEETYALFGSNYGGAALRYLGLHTEAGKSYEMISVKPAGGHAHD